MELANHISCFCVSAYLILYNCLWYHVFSNLLVACNVLFLIVFFLFI